jgi:hypothetical protein
VPLDWLSLKALEQTQQLKIPLEIQVKGLPLH